MGLWTNKMVSSSPRSKRPFVARSKISAGSGRVWEGKWSQRVRGGRFRTAELDVAASRVAQGVHALD